MNNTPRPLSDVQKVAEQTTRWYLKKMPWARSHGPDMLQEAVLAVLTADRTFNPAKGDWRTLANFAAERACRRYINNNAAQTSHHSRTDFNRPPEEPLDAPREVPLRLVCSNPTPAEVAELRQASRYAYEIVHRLDSTQEKLGVRVILGERPAELVAEGHQLKKVRYAVKNTMRRMESSHELRALKEAL